jgi:GT2 family glycosyltransferase
MSGPVSIVIPSYNGLDLLKNYLPPARKALEAYAGGGELIVVDDGSRDGSKAWLESQAGVRVLALEKNQGFQKACSAGIEAAQNEWIILLNSDVEVSPGFIEPLVAALSRDEVFSVGCLALDEAGARVGENLKIPYLSFGRLKFRKLPPMELERCQALLGSARPTLFATGGFMALKKSLFHSLGGFDPLFEPFYFEEADLCFRAWKQGYKVLLEPASVVNHRHVGSILALHSNRYVRRIQERNRLILLWKNVTDPGYFLARHLAPLAFRALFKWVVLDFDFYAALWGALARLNQILAARKKEKKEALKSDASIFREIRETNADLWRDA